MKRHVRSLLVASPLLLGLAACGTGGGPSAVGSASNVPDPVALAKLEGPWVGTGAVQGVRVLINRAGSSAPMVKYAFRDEAPSTPNCVAAGAALRCEHASGLTTTYTATAEGADFTAKGAAKDDKTIEAKLVRPPRQ